MLGAGGGSGAQNTLVWVDREGREEPLGADPLDYRQPDVSPEGGRVAVVRGAADEADIWVYDLTDDTLTPLPHDGDDAMPRWHPDGQRIAFASRERGVFNLYWRAADATGTVDRLTTSPNRQFPTSWSRDGTRLLFYECSQSCDLGVLSLEGEPTAELVLETQFNEVDPALSPDGRWVAYMSNQSGQQEIYVRPFPDVDARQRLVSTDGGQQPVWGPEGRELFYWSPAGFMGVPVETDPTFARGGTPEVLFDLGPYQFSVGRNHALAPDGERLLMIKAGTATTDSTAPAAQIVLVENWFEELQRLVPIP